MAARSEGSRNDQQAKGRDVGWGIALEGDDEGIWLRKLIFGASVAIVICLCGWILLTSALDEAARPVLNASGAEAYTVLLRAFDPSERQLAEGIASAPEVRRLAEGSSFHYVELSDGRWALCVGQAQRRDSPALEQLVRRFRAYRTASGKCPFESAAVLGCPE
ncbi:MAG: hypothetical protein R6V05_03385 [Candidatus Brocadiia bacterium]